MSWPHPKDAMDPKKWICCHTTFSHVNRLLICLAIMMLVSTFNNYRFAKKVVGPVQIRGVLFCSQVTMPSSSTRQVFQKQSELVQRSISRRVFNDCSVFMDPITIWNFARVHCVTSKTMTIKMDLLAFFANR